MAGGSLSTFMAAIRQIESGSVTGNYTQTKTGGRIVGAYGFSLDNWRKWSAEVGLEGASWRSKTAQDAVAKAKFSQMYAQYGDWRLVAAAWFGGSEAVELITGQGLDALNASVRSDVEKVSTYLGLNASAYGEEIARRGDVVRDQATQQRLASLPPPSGGGTIYVDVPVYGQITPSQAPTQTKRDPATEARLRSSDMHRNISSVLQGLSNAVRQGAQFPEGAGVPEAEQVQTGRQEEDEE